ncbi:MAG TPA: insulinase family protein [Abditibacteriaceae bacterium]|jgi:hypothetical protein
MTSILSQPAVLDGFSLVRSVALPAIRAHAFEYQHPKSGARLLHVASEDSENALAVAFPTPPSDDTGLPHILEHAVLGGSRKYPVKEPFFEMIKSSMATFINAMTSQSYTIYPISTTVKNDFFNLAQVYADAVFHPLLTEDTFRREGQHRTLEDNDDLESALKVSGIVFNEMKGAYSSPESRVWSLANRSLFPDTPLGRDSGGDPKAIPDLTFEQFTQFHRDRYHPQNALIFVYGDIPTEEHLRFWKPILDEFSADVQSKSTVHDAPRQKRWDAPRQIEDVYPIEPGEDPKERTFLMLSWLVGDAMNPDTSTDWSVLSQVLLGHEAAPLRRAIIESKLGADVFGAGADDHEYEMTFRVGLKGTEAERADAFEKLVFDTLREISSAPIEARHIEAALQQLAYQTLEVKSLFPLHVAFDVNATWPFGGDPLLFLNKGQHLEESRARWEANPNHFNELIVSGLLENPHRLRTILKPDADAQSRADAEFAARMAEERAKLSPKQIAEIARAAKELEAAQDESNTEEALKTLPCLGVADLPATPRRIPTSRETVAGFTVLRNDVFSNGVNTIDAAIDLAGLPEELLVHTPRWCEAFHKMGAAGESYEQIAERRAACTGGLWASPTSMRSATDDARTVEIIRVGLKTLDREAVSALNLLTDLTFGTEATDRARLEEIHAQAVAGVRTRLVNDGLGTARAAAGRTLSPELRRAHSWMSPEVLRRLEKEAANLDEASREIADSVAQMREAIANRTRWTWSFTGSDTAYASFCRTLEDWAARMKEDAIPASTVEFDRTSGVREGWAGPMNVAYCARALPGYAAGDTRLPLVRLGLYLAGFDYFLPEIRLKGNAYGAGANYDDASATCQMYSYRDPNIAPTLDVFDGLKNWAQSQNWSQPDIDRAIIGSAKDAEKPIRPTEATMTALVRYVRGDSDERRDRDYNIKRGATPESVQNALVEFLENAGSGNTAVASSREKLESANAGLEIHDILP